MANVPKFEDMVPLDEEPPRFEDMVPLDAEPPKFEDTTPENQVIGDDELAKSDSLWSQIAEDTSGVTPEALAGEVAQIPEALYNLPGFVKEQAPKEFNKLLEQPGEVADFAAKKLAQGASIVGPQHNLSAAYEKYIVAPVLDKVRSAAAAAGLTDEFSDQQGLKEAATTWVPERYRDRAVTDIAAQNKARQQKQEADMPLTSLVTSLPGPIALQASGIPIPVTLGLQKTGEVFEETGRPIKALSEGTKAALLTELTGRVLNKAGKGIVSAPGKARQWISDKAALETAKSFGGTPSTMAKAGREKLIAAGEEARPLVKGLQSKETLRERLSDKIKELGSKLGTNVDDISSELAETNPSLVRNKIGDIGKIADDYIVKTEANVGDHPALFNLRQKLKELRSIGEKTSVEVQGTESAATSPTFKNLNEFKKELGNEINSWQKAGHERVPDAITQKGYKALYGQVKQALEELADTAGGGKGGQYKQVKQSISRLKLLEKPAFEGMRQEMQQDVVSSLPGGLRLPIRALQYTATPFTAPLEMAHQAAKTYGPQAAAQGFGAAEKAISGVEQVGKKALSGMERVEKTVKSMAETVAERIPGNVSKKLLKVIQVAPQKLGQYAKALQAAMPRGSTALAATSYMLHTQYPEYREMLRQIEEEKE